MKNIIMLSLLALLFGCKATVKEDAINVIYFIGEDRSETCKAMESLTKEVLDENFSSNLKRGEFVFTVVDVTTPEGEALAQEYETSGNALFISQTVEGETSKKDLSRLGYIFASSEPENYKKEIKAVFTEIAKTGIANMGAIRPQTQIEGC